ncbi:hypothetical protein [Holospora curviuscula]|uniref:Uncharacterized protein n=1 Tax=Holospora curviuscula TaxID=1082868 RepID=A0A2S5R7R8_9PROT|nr:hypothetical protein [Holospora curviuscula]PPE03364.1 hypothetical protein HCUR_01196 [Holospora curviuscula]
MKALRRLGVRYKKTFHHSKTDPQKRSVFYQKRDELNRKVDERGVAHDMPRPYGYSVKGQPCYAKEDWGSKSRTNGIGALMGSTLGAIRLLMGSVEVLACWGGIGNFSNHYPRKPFYCHE